MGRRFLITPTGLQMETCWETFPNEIEDIPLVGEEIPWWAPK